MKRQRVGLANWAYPLTQPKRFKVLYGGRGSGKSWQIAHVLVWKAYNETLTIHCCRETMKSLEDSSKRILERAIHNMKLESDFSIQKDKVICKSTGSTFTFHGLGTSRESIRGWEGVDICWVDEAQRMSEESFEILRPSIRKAGSEIWFSFNPQYRYQPVWREFVGINRDDAFVQKVNFKDNPFFTPELRNEMKNCEKYNPDRFRHIWLGEPDDEGVARKVLTYDKLELCIEAYKKFKTQGSSDYISENNHIYGGLDIADTGPDSNAFAVRSGGVLMAIEKWKSPDLKRTTLTTRSFCKEHKVVHVFYDMGGVGAGIKSHFNEDINRDFTVEGINFGSAVAGAETFLTYPQMNGDLFMRRNSQLAWCLRLRAENTARLMKGEAIDPYYCLFINPILESYLAELTQTDWWENETGKIVIDKTPDNSPSPDAFDAVSLAFASDSRLGLTSSYFPQADSDE